MGGIARKIIAAIFGVVIAGALIVALWPTFVGTDTDIQALTQTDAGTVTLQAIWPILLIIVPIGIAVVLVVKATRSKA